MGEAHPRAMEDGWIPGEVQWPAPVDCLLSGMNTSDAHMMFGGNGNHMLPPQFRHRFHPPMHIATSASHLVELPGSININLSIPPHSMVEGNGQVQVDQVDNGSALVSDAGQGGHSLPLDNRNMLEDTDDATDEDDEDEVEDDELSVNMPHPHETHDGVPLSHIMNDESLVQCQQVPVQVQGGLHQQQQPTMMSMSEAHCHPKQLSNNGLLRQVMNGHEQQQHALQQHSHPHAHVSSMMPIFTEQVDFGVNESQQPQQVQQQQNENSDPNSGFSVHGKMYLEGRIVLHLKQWNDPHSNNDGLSFPSCAEDHHKNHLLGCAVCRLNTPMSHGQENHRVQKEAHRHTVKGVFFTFEDCTIVELYPEQFNCTISSTEIKQNGHPKQQLNHQNQQIPISYLNSTLPQQPQQPQHNPPKRHIIQPLDIENLSVGPQTIITAQQQQQQQQSLQSDKPQPHDNEDDSWLDEFESAPEGEDELKENESTEDDSNPVPDELNSSSCPNLNNHHQEDTNDDEDDDDRDDEDIEDDDYREKPLKYHSSADHTEYADSGKLSTNNGQIETHAFQTQNNNRALNDELDMSSSEGNMGASDPITPEPNPSGSLAEVLRVESEESCHSTTIRSLIKMRNDLKSDMKRVAEQPPPNGKYRCPMPSCAKSFHFKKLLKRHLEEDHASGNPFLCTQCGLQCTDDKRFKQHICSIRRRLLLKRIGTNSAKSSKAAKNDRPRKNPVKKVNEEYKVEGEKSEEEADSREQLRSSSSRSETTTKMSGNSKSTIVERDKNESQEDDGSSSGQEDEIDDGLGDNSNDDESMEATSNSKSQSSDQKRKDRGGKSFKCDVCGKSFSMERRLENHKLSHGAEKTSQCEKCGKRFARKDKLMRHMFVHNEEKMFSCDKCGKKFSRRDKLTDHLKSHGGADEIHNCPMCQKQFLRPDILKQHLKLHGMGNKHQCPECLRFVTGQDRLQKHMARHVEAKALGQTLLCPLCTKYFIQRQSLRAHIKKFHPYSDIDVDGSQGPTGQGQSNSDEGLDLEDQLSLGTGSSSGKITQSEEFKVLECAECGKQFSKKATFKKHLRKHGHTPRCVGKQESPSPTIATSAASVILPQDQNVDTEDSDGMEESQKDIVRERSPSEDDLAIMENPSPVHIHSSAPPSCLLMSMSFASQLGSSCSVSSSSSSSPPMTAIVESGPPRTILSTQRPLSTTISHFSLNPHQHHLHQHIPGNSNGLAAHIPLSLAAAAAAVSSPPSMTSSSQQNGLLSLGTSQTTHLTTHALHSHHHHLLQHSHSHGHSTSPQGLIHSPIVHPQGHLHAHLGQHMPISSMQHHVNVSMATQQTMCGSPYVLYPHYPYQ